MEILLNLNNNETSHVSMAKYRGPTYRRVQEFLGINCQ